MVNKRKFLSHDFISLFCEKNSDGTRHLRLKGRDLFQRIGRRLTADDMPEIIRYLKYFPTVTSIDFCYNDIGDEGIKTLVDTYFCRENDMQHLNLMHCDLTGKSLIYLNESLYLNLKSLRINGNLLEPQSAHLISQLLKGCETLEDLDIAETSMTFESIANICRWIEVCNRLKILDISRVVPKSNLYVNNSAILANDLGYLLDKNSSLKELHAQKCDFMGHDMELLLYGLKTNKTLIMLDLGCNRIGNYGVELLAKWLKTKPALRGLNLSNNQIGEIGARALSLAIPYASLRLLDISYNDITDTGMNHILFCLKKTERLRMLYMWGNPITSVSNMIIARLLRTQILAQEHIDVKVYYVDGVAYAAYYPGNHYKHRYYCVMDHGCPVEIKIKKNRIPDEDTQRPAMVDLKYYDRIPPYEFPPKPRRQTYYCDSRCLDKVEFERAD